jgi:hypothetical protein
MGADVAVFVVLRLYRHLSVLVYLDGPSEQRLLSADV